MLRLNKTCKSEELNMKKIGVLLFGLSLLTLAVVIFLDKVAESLFSIANNPTYATPISGYILI